MIIKKVQVFIVLLIIPLAGLYLYAVRQNVGLSDFFTLGTPVLHIGDMPVRVVIADTQELREKGLSGRDEFINASGLLFVFDTPEVHQIWMKDMLFPIDVIWISEDLKVVAIEKGLSPDSYPRRFRPPVPVLYALETKMHYADTFGISVGQTVTLPAELRKR